MTRPVPERAVALIKSFEKLVLEVYLDPVGIPTAGWGHVVLGGKEGTKVTQRQAELWLADDLSMAVKRLERKIGPVVKELSDGQFGALVSFVFNLGTGDPKKAEWKIWGLLRQGAFDQVPAQMRRFVNAGGKRLNGLVRRRDAEVSLWYDGEEPPEVPSSANTRHTPTPPTPESQATPVAKSGTFWGGVVVAASGVVEAAKQVQAEIVPQVAHAPWLKHADQVVALVIVGVGVGIVLLKVLDREKAKR